MREINKGPTIRVHNDMSSAIQIDREKFEKFYNNNSGVASPIYNKDISKELLISKRKDSETVRNSTKPTLKVYTRRVSISKPNVSDLVVRGKSSSRQSDHSKNKSSMNR